MLSFVQILRCAPGALVQVADYAKSQCI
jgi:hypothetical protein